MAKDKARQLKETGGANIHFTLLGLTIFSVSLVIAGGLLTSGLMSLRSRRPAATAGVPATSSDAEVLTPPASQNTPPWGELLVRDIEVERPEEYAASEMERVRVPTWVFEQQTPNQVRALLLKCGLTANQADQALAPALVSTSATNTVLTPPDELALALSVETRAKLYGELARFPSNHYMRYPFCFQGESFEEAFESSNLAGTVIDRVRKLLYPRGNGRCFSDFELVMRGLPSDQERLWLLKALSRQHALLVRLQIRPETDIDKILNYWDRGIQVKDARPLLESVKRLDGGGTISLLYLLPNFARQRLYTFPEPPKPGEPAMDCHWSTMNFFNDTPDDRFANTAFTAQYIETNFYPVATANSYGDVVLVMNGQGNAIHSAVHIAEDIVFTKNGNNYAQPWMLTRLKDLQTAYACDPGVHLAFYRRKSW